MDAPLAGPGIWHHTAVRATPVVARGRRVA